MSRSALVAVCGAMAMSALASAEPVLRMDFTQLSTSYDARTNLLIAQAVNVESLASAGRIERVVSPTGVATFSPPGNVSNDAWSFVLASTVVLDSAEMATGVGFFVATDHNGDSFRAELRTTFQFTRPGEIEMSATVRNFQFTNIVDGRFEGSDAQGWSMSMGSTEDIAGNVQAHLLGGTTFFSGSFAGRDMDLTGDLVPAPGGVLVGLGSVLWMTRRRRHAV